MQLVTKFDCSLWFTGSSGINYDGMFSITGNNNGVLPGFISDLDSLGTWSTKKISMFLGTSSAYLDYNNVDSSLIDSGGPWEITSSVSNFYRFYLYSIQH